MIELFGLLIECNVPSIDWGSRTVEYAAKHIT